MLLLFIHSSIFIALALIKSAFRVRTIPHKDHKQLNGITIKVCMKILQPNKEAASMRPERYFPLIIHKVIHRNCGKDSMCLIVKFE
jgi:hypothetical protein